MNPNAFNLNQIQLQALQGLNPAAAAMAQLQQTVLAAQAGAVAAAPPPSRYQRPAVAHPAGQVQQPAVPHLRQALATPDLQSKINVMAAQIAEMAEMMKAVVESRGLTNKPSLVEQCQRTNADRDVEVQRMRNWAVQSNGVQAAQHSAVVALRGRTDTLEARVQALTPTARKMISLLAKKNTRQRAINVKLAKVLKKERAEMEDRLRDEIKEWGNQKNDQIVGLAQTLDNVAQRFNNRLTAQEEEIEGLKKSLEVLPTIKNDLKVQKEKVSEIRSRMEEQEQKLQTTNNQLLEVSQALRTSKDDLESLRETMETKMADAMKTLTDKQDDKTESAMDILRDEQKEKLGEMERRLDEKLKEKAAFEALKAIELEEKLKDMKKELDEDLRTKSQNADKEVEEVKEAAKRAEEKTDRLGEEMKELEKKVPGMAELEQKMEEMKIADTERSQQADTLVAELIGLFKTEGQKVMDKLNATEQQVQTSLTNAQDKILEVLRGKLRKIATMKKELSEELSYEFFSKLVPPHLRVVPAHLLAAALAGPSGANPAAAAPPAAASIAASQPGPSGLNSAPAQPAQAPGTPAPPPGPGDAASSSSTPDPSNTAGPSSSTSSAPAPRKRGRPSKTDQVAKKSRSD